MKFSWKKMLKKSFKVGTTATIGTAGVLGVSGENIIPAFFAGLGSAVLTAIVNYINERIKKL